MATISPAVYYHENAEWLLTLSKSDTPTVWLGQWKSDKLEDGENTVYSMMIDIKRAPW